MNSAGAPAGRELSASSAGPPGPWGVLATLLWTLAMAGMFMLASLGALAIFNLHFGLDQPGPRGLLAVPRSHLGDLVWIQQLGFLATIGPLLGAALYLRRGYPVRDYLALKGVARRPLLGFTAALVGLMAVSDLTLRQLGIDPLAPWMIDVFKNVSCPACLIVAVVAIAPALEEAVFRGFILAGFQRRFGDVAAVVVATVPWALIHTQYEWPYLIVALALGTLLSIARIKTGSLLAPILLHALNNAVAFVELYLWA